MTTNHESGEVKHGHEARVALVTQLSSPGIWDWASGSNDLALTPRGRSIFGFGLDDVVSIFAFRAAIHPEDRGWLELFSQVPVSTPPAVPILCKFRIYRRDTGELRWISSRIWPHHAITPAPGEKPGLCGTLEDVTQTIETAQALTESEERLRLAIEAGNMAVWDVDLETGKMSQSRELNVLCGFPAGMEVNLENVRSLYNPGEIARLAREGNTVEAVRERAVGGAFEPWHKGAHREGGDRTQVQAEVAITTPNGVPKRLMLRAQYAPSPEGHRRLTGLLVDITEAKHAQDRLALVAQELQHRVKNLLSVIQAIALKSLAGKTDPKAALKSYLGRLAALGAANDLILQRGSSTAELRDVIGRIVHPYLDDARNPFVLEGPTTELNPDVAMAIGMILHELCTNAVKYGALSAPAGEVILAWERSGADLTLSWRERNGPPVTRPNSSGFGKQLMENILSGSLAGKVTLDYPVQGLECRIQVRPGR